MRSASNPRPFPPLALCALLAALGAPAHHARAAAGPGEFDLRTVLVLDGSALAARRAEPPSPESLARLRAEAAPALDAAPAPLARIRYEGLVNTHPDRVADVEKLRVLDAVAALVELWQATGDPELAVALRRHVLAWAETYAPTGNDVNENKLIPLYVAALSLRPTLSAADLAVLDPWMRRLGELHTAALHEDRPLGNRYAKRLRLVALFADWAGRDDWREAVREGFRRFVAASLRPDGTSYDLERRDSLGYHVSALVSALELLRSLPRDEAAALYAWSTPEGASVQNSVRFVLPYAAGEKIRRDWINSKVGLDHARAAAGIPEYQPGAIYDPRRARPMLELAAPFDPAVPPVLARLASDA